MVVGTQGDGTAITGLFPATSGTMFVLSAISTTQMAKSIKTTDKHQEERYKIVKTKLTIKSPKPIAN